MHISTDKSNTQGNISTARILIYVLPVSPYTSTVSLWLLQNAEKKHYRM